MSEYQDTKAKYESISSIHIYSLESSTIQVKFPYTVLTERLIMVESRGPLNSDTKDHNRLHIRGSPDTQ